MRFLLTLIFLVPVISPAWGQVQPSLAAVESAPEGWPSPDDLISRYLQPLRQYVATKLSLDYFERTLGPDTKCYMDDLRAPTMKFCVHITRTERTGLRGKIVEERIGYAVNSRTAGVFTVYRVGESATPWPSEKYFTAKFPPTETLSEYRISFGRVPSRIKLIRNGRNAHFEAEALREGKISLHENILGNRIFRSAKATFPDNEIPEVYAVSRRIAPGLWDHEYHFDRESAQLQARDFIMVMSIAGAGGAEIIGNILMRNLRDTYHWPGL